MAGSVVGAYFGVLLTLANVLVLGFVSTAQIFEGIFTLGFISLGVFMLSKIYRKNKEIYQVEEKLRADESDSEYQKNWRNLALFDQLKMIQPTTMQDSPLLSQSYNRMFRDFNQIVESSLAFLNIVAGFMCYFLDKQKFSELEDSSKSPMYALVATCLTFVAVYIVLDATESIFDLIQEEIAPGKPRRRVV